MNHVTASHRALVGMSVAILAIPSLLAWAGTHTISARKCVSIASGTADCQETADKIRDWTVTVTGKAFYGPNLYDVWDSAVIQYLTPEGHIEYDTVRIGGSKLVHGRNLHVFVTDTSMGDNSGSLTVTVK